MFSLYFDRVESWVMAKLQHQDQRISGDRDRVKLYAFTLLMLLFADDVVLVGFSFTFV